VKRRKFRWKSNEFSKYLFLFEKPTRELRHERKNNHITTQTYSRRIACTYSTIFRFVCTFWFIQIIKYSKARFCICLLFSSYLHLMCEGSSFIIVSFLQKITVNKNNYCHIKTLYNIIFSWIFVLFFFKEKCIHVLKL